MFDISTTLATISTTMEVAKAIKKAGTALSDAETNFKMAEIIDGLANTKGDLADLKILLIDKDIKIRELEESLKTKESLTYDGSKYIKENYDHPFCPKCYDDKNNKLIHLKYIKAHPGSNGHVSFPATPAYYSCPVCNYSTNNTKMPSSK